MSPEKSTVINLLSNAASNTAVVLGEIFRAPGEPSTINIVHSQWGPKWDPGPQAIPPGSAPSPVGSLNVGPPAATGIKVGTVKAADRDVVIAELKVAKEPRTSGKPTRSGRSPSSVAKTNSAVSIVVAPFFKMIFLSVFGITIACGATQIILAGLWPTTTPNQQAVFEAVSFTWKAGIGAIFGLLGGKVA